MRIITIKSKYDNTELDVHCNYAKGEKSTREYPGCSEEYEPYAVLDGDNDVSGIINFLGKWEEIKEMVFEQVEKDKN